VLRDYQTADVAEIRPLIRDHSSVLHQLPTGGGKTAEVSAMVSLIRGLNPTFVIWFVVPRNELLQQASEHFERWKIPHGHIAAGREESRAFKVQLVSKDTLLRRLGRVKTWPDVIFFDECHLYYDAQLAIIEAARAQKPALRVIGLTATPERLDGRGLAVEAGGPYEAIHFGPSIPWLTDRGFLSPLRYFAPPIQGLDSVHRRGTEYDSGELEALLEKRKVYGDVIRYYQKYGSISQRSISTPGAPIGHAGAGYHRGKPALIFCRSVRSAYETAQRFTEAGYLFFTIEGAMRKGERRRLIEALRRGEIDGLTNCDLATYGLDIPRVEYGASIRPTLSRALYFQMVGRILRPFQGKDEALFFDHANLVSEHTDVASPGVPLFYLPELTWNFYGRERRERAPVSTELRLCPLKDYQYCSDPACRGGCKLDPSAAVSRGELETVDARLEERTPPRMWTMLDPEERREVQDRIGAASDAWLSALQEDPPRLDPGPVGELLRIAEELGRAPMWVYYHLSEREIPMRAEAAKVSVERYRQMPRAVNVPLLVEIGRQAKKRDGTPYARGWAWMKKKELEREAEERAEAGKELVG